MHVSDGCPTGAVYPAGGCILWEKQGGEAHGCGEGGNENDTGIMQSGKKILWSPACPGEYYI